MANFSERPWEMRHRDQDSFQFRTQLPPPPQPVRRGRGAGQQVDIGTVALALSAMTFYWVMPLMMGSRIRRRAPHSGQAE